MTYLELKKRIVKLSGRIDLVVNTTAYVDADPVGVDFFVNAAIRYLENRIVHESMSQEIEDTLAEDAYEYELSSEVRSIESVQVEADDGWIFLEHLTYDNFLDAAGEPLDEADSGEPEYWTSDKVVTVPDDETKDRILIYPPADQDYTIRLIVNYKQSELSADSDTNFWTDQYPDLLIAATMMKLEYFYRNRSGVADWQEQVEAQIRDIEFNLVETQSAGIDQRADGWNFV